MGSIGIQAESIHGGAEPGSMARKAVAYRASKAALNAGEHSCWTPAALLPDSFVW